MVLAALEHLDLLGELVEEAEALVRVDKMADIMELAVEFMVVVVVVELADHGMEPERLVPSASSGAQVDLSLQRTQETFKSWSSNSTNRESLRASRSWKTTLSRSSLA
jgi:hypothetical protein